MPVTPSHGPLCEVVHTQRQDPPTILGGGLAFGRHEAQGRFVALIFGQHSLIVEQTMDVMCAHWQFSNCEVAIVVLLPSKPMDGTLDVHNFNAILSKYFNVLTSGVPNTKFIFLHMDKFDLVVNKDSGTAIAVTLVLPMVCEKAGSSRTAAIHKTLDCVQSHAPQL